MSRGGARGTWAFGLAAALLALAYAPMADLRSLVAYVVTLQAVALGIVVANVWAARRRGQADRLTRGEGDNLGHRAIRPPGQSTPQVEDQREARDMTTRRQFYVALVVLAVSGLVGGGLSNWLLPGGMAWAQEAGVAKEVRAERFVLVDEAGEVRAKLAMEVGGELALGLYDEAGEGRVGLFLDMNGEPGLSLIDAAGEVRAGLALVDGEPVLALWDEAGEAGAMVSVSDIGPSLVLSDAAGQKRVVLGSTETEDARTGATITHPISTITLFGETGEVEWQAP